MKNESAYIIEKIKVFILNSKLSDGLLKEQETYGFNLACEYLSNEIDKALNCEDIMYHLRNLIRNHNWFYADNPLIKENDRIKISDERNTIIKQLRIIPMNEAYKLLNIIPLKYRYEILFKIQKETIK